MIDGDLLQNLEIEVDKDIDVERAYNGSDVSEACYEGERSMLKHTLEDRTNIDLNDNESRKIHLFNFISQLLAEDEVFRSELKRQYQFDGLESLELSSLNDKQAEEVSILIRALEQTICLVYYNQTLKNMLKNANLGLIPSHIVIPNFIAAIEKQGLKVQTFNHDRGIRNDPKNHGALVLDSEGKMELHLDLKGQKDIRELCHEYAAYEFLRKALDDQEPHFDYDEILAETKFKKLKYVLLFIDLFSDRLELINKYINLI